MVARGPPGSIEPKPTEPAYTGMPISAACVLGRVPRSVYKGEPLTRTAIVWFSSRWIRPR